MTDPHWDSSTQCWRLTVEIPGQDSVDVHVQTDGEAFPPDENQLRAIRLLRAIDESTVEVIRRKAIDDFRTRLDSERFAAFIADGAWIHIWHAMVPPLHETDGIYFFLDANTDFDYKRGFACVCRDGVDYRTCRTEDVHRKYTSGDINLAAKYFSGR